jgi:tRNA-Thr(GGU) m(6)t(6)A37 methyltransferase TsaA
MTIELEPIGLVHSELKSPSLKAGNQGIGLVQRLDRARSEHKRIKDLVSQIELRQEHLERLEGIEGFSHILVLYWPHLVDPERRSLEKIHPMGRPEFPRTGVLATCSPARPNPVLASVVPLISRNGVRLEVRGLEAVDGSPVLDIKPYNPGYLRVEDPGLPDWMQRIQQELQGP